jgi:hypothetical protein
VAYRGFNKADRDDDGVCVCLSAFLLLFLTLVDDIMIEYSYTECTSAALQGLFHFAKRHPDHRPDEIRYACTLNQPNITPLGAGARA